MRIIGKQVKVLRDPVTVSRKAEGHHLMLSVRNDHHATGHPSREGGHFFNICRQAGKPASSQYRLLWKAAENKNAFHRKHQSRSRGVDRTKGRKKK